MSVYQKKLSGFLVLLLICVSIAVRLPAQSSDLIKVYFNNPVDTSLSSGEYAVYLNQSMDDTLVAYINRAKFTLDIAVYNYSQSSQIADLAAAINNAYNRGVRIRWIYDGSSSNNGLSGVNANIRTLGSPTTSNYGIMHNKFIVFDAHSINPADPVVWTGSTNWSNSQMNYDVNNSVVIQDRDLALAYTTEFNEMWGDTGLVPNTSLSKFGPFKTNNTQHIFTIGGKTVECYFSPSDASNSQILRCIRSADSEMFFGVYTFTHEADADSIAHKIQDGIYVAGIMDAFSLSYPAYSVLSPIMGSDLQIFNGSGIYHSKFMIADPCDSLSDPLVETGSHNWSISADPKNDENLLIIHDAKIANMYYQSFAQNFADLGGVLSSCITNEIDEASSISGIRIYPNPANNFLVVESDAGFFNKISLSDIHGKTVSEIENQKNRSTRIDLSRYSAGIYFLTIDTGSRLYHDKVVVTK